MTRQPASPGLAGETAHMTNTKCARRYPTGTRFTKYMRENLALRLEDDDGTVVHE